MSKFEALSFALGAANSKARSWPKCVLGLPDCVNTCGTRRIAVLAFRATDLDAVYLKASNPRSWLHVPSVVAPAREYDPRSHLVFRGTSGQMGTSDSPYRWQVAFAELVG